jgi:NTP pyrophosphatase (non-canonical NTP hydrolase)
MTTEQERIVKSFPDLNKNLEILAEECAEVIQSKSKLIRFGINHRHHVTGRPAIDHLQDEIGDVMAMIDILVASGVLDKDGLGAARDRKLKKLELWYNT